jgi:hypothetical protein
MVEWLTETLLLDDSLIILKYNVFIDRTPCTKLHKREQKDRTKTLAEFPNHVLKDYGLVGCGANTISRNVIPPAGNNGRY